MSKALVVIPTYNESENISRIIAAARRSIPADILVVDDNSPDGTGTIVSNMSQKASYLHVINRPKKLGLASAYTAGFLFGLSSGYDYIFQMDADFSHDPNYLAVMMRYAENSDLVIGSRYMPDSESIGLTRARRLLSVFGNLYVRTFLNLRSNDFKIRDSTSGFCCWRASLLRKIDVKKLRFRGYAFQAELKWLAVNHDASIKEIPVVYRNRAFGKSKMSTRIIAEGLTLPFRLSS